VRLFVAGRTLGWSASRRLRMVLQHIDDQLGKRHARTIPADCTCRGRPQHLLGKFEFLKLSMKVGTAKGYEFPEARPCGPRTRGTGPVATKRSLHARAGVVGMSTPRALIAAAGNAHRVPQDAPWMTKAVDVFGLIKELVLMLDQRPRRGCRRALIGICNESGHG
jgi:hypothetical protein